jgi:hypothetical protein
MKPGDIRLPLLLCVAGGLALYLWFGASDQPGERTRAPTNAGSAGVAADQRFAVPPSTGSVHEPASGPAGKSGSRLQQQWLRDIAARPLFSETRRMPSKPVVVKPKPRVVVIPPQQNNLQLVGVMKGDGRSIALLRHVKSKRRYQAKVGDVIDSWKVKEITSNSVVLQGRRRVETLPLFK